MAIEIVKLIDDPRLRLGIVEVEGGTVGPASHELRETASGLSARMGTVDYDIPEDKRRAVRQLLKIGGFSPSGRNRPAHELLVRDLKERGSFHHINNIVDVNNLISLISLLPISVFDGAKLETTITVRVGQPEEGYVFNQSGQWLDVKKCITCCNGEAPGKPIGTPVKDSMATKIFEGASHYLGVIYSSTEGWSIDELTDVTQRFADLLARESRGEIVQCRIL
jgi:DNA/RNA-binding domain of Phe-tRNA-synthetase-like protein